MSARLRWGSLVDSLAVLLLFLRKSFLAEGAVMTPAPGVSLPESTSKTTPESSVVVAILDDKIMLDGRVVAQVPAGAPGADPLIPAPPAPPGPNQRPRPGPPAGAGGRAPAAGEQGGPGGPAHPLARLAAGGGPPGRPNAAPFVVGESAGINAREGVGGTSVAPYRTPALADDRPLPG